MAEEAPYGAWRSPITAQMLATGSLRLSGVSIDGGKVWWLEGRPGEGGRNALVREGADITAKPWNVRTRAHEYGGGAYLVDGGNVWFVHFDDQRIYHKAPGSEPVPVTAAGPWRYADMVFDEARGRLLSIRENHEAGGEPRNEVVGIRLGDGSTSVLAEGCDFYSNPSLSPDGGRLAWLAWDHPNMPWDETELWVADVAADGALGEPRRIAGGNGVSVFQPSWSPAGELWFVADPMGWWNLNRWDGESVECVLGMEAEFGLPQWVFGMSTYGFAGDGSVVCAWCERGEWRAGRLDTASGNLSRFDLDLTDIEHVAVEGDYAAFLGGLASQPVSVVRYDIATGDAEVLRSSTSLEIDPDWLSEPERIVFPTGGGATAHAVFYAPRNAAFSAPAGELPPLLVMAHGGPTGATSAALSLRIQYWTSRGIAVLDVDYRCSTGYGRAYRDLLRGEWGIADVEDCVRGALHLAGRGLIDRGRLAIRGGSAGGYLVLAALAFHDVFGAGASYYGIGDLAALARDTHKFESRYLDRLVGPYPERADLYRERSPLYHADRINCPVIFFQGLEDKVVLPNQAEAMVDALKRRGVPVAYHAFEGEQHGFRRAETIRATLEAELTFYGRVFGFDR